MTGILSQQGVVMKKITGIILLLLAVIILAACQANYIRDVQGGTVAPSSSSELTGIAVQQKRSKDLLEILFFCA